MGKGIDSGATKLPPVQMQLGNDGIKSDYVSFTSWPPSTNDWSTVQYVVGPRQGEFGTLSRNALGSMQLTDTISFNARHDRLTTGTILLSDFLKDVVPITSSLGDVDPSHAIVYATGVLSKSQTTRICGVPRLVDLTVVPTQPKFQVVAYLYDLDTNTGKGRL